MLCILIRRQRLPSCMLNSGCPWRRSARALSHISRRPCRTSSAVRRLKLQVDSNIVSHAVQGNLKPIAGIKNIIAIASGKGGVGKSTVAVNVALALSRAGAHVGILDADIYGPVSRTCLIWSAKRPSAMTARRCKPLSGHGLKVMSIGFLVNPDQPMVWRGPMVTSALNQLMHQTEWGDLDYLIVDMPPGTGDIQLTCRKRCRYPVRHRDDAAEYCDARRAQGLAMFRKVSIPVLGVVENMSTHICSSCGHEEADFRGRRCGAKMVNDFRGAVTRPSCRWMPAFASRPTAARPPLFRRRTHRRRRHTCEAALKIAAAQARSAPITVRSSAISS